MGRLDDVHERGMRRTDLLNHQKFLVILVLIHHRLSVTRTWSDDSRHLSGLARLLQTYVLHVFADHSRFRQSELDVSAFSTHVCCLGQNLHWPPHSPLHDSEPVEKVPSLLCTRVRFRGQCLDCHLHLRPMRSPAGRLDLFPTRKMLGPGDFPEVY